MAEQPQQHEIGIDLTREHRFQVEFEIRLAGQAGVIAQDTQAQPIGDQPPQALIVTVEQLLHQAVRAGSGSPSHTGGAPVQVNPAAHQVDGHIRPTVRDGVSLALDLDGFGCRQPPIAQLLEERQQPAFTRQRGAGSPSFEPVLAGLEGCPGSLQAVPRAVDRLVELLTWGEVVALRRQAHPGPYHRRGHAGAGQPGGGSLRCGWR